MKIKKLNLVFFSPAGNTAKIMRYIAEGTGAGEITEYDITQEVREEICFDAGEVLLVGIPVYSGRIPPLAVQSLHQFTGNNTPAIIVCVYGNRDYDDELLELKDLVESNHFKVISAGAFIAEHSIFPQVGRGRPDDADKRTAIAFVKKSMEIINNNDLSYFASSIRENGKFPYKEIIKIPLRPKGNNRCNRCGTCVRSCPSEAINMEHPRKTDKGKCISCARCIVVCPRDARLFGGILYRVFGKKFVADYSLRKEPDTVFITD